MNDAKDPQQDRLEGLANDLADFATKHAGWQDGDRVIVIVGSDPHGSALAVNGYKDEHDGDHKILSDLFAHATAAANELPCAGVKIINVGAN